MTKGEKVFILGLILFCGFMYLEANRIPEPIGASYIMKASLIPKLMLGGAILFSLILLVKDWRKTVKEGSASAEGEEFEKPNRIRMILIFTICLIYTYAMWLVGFLISTPLFVFIILYISEYRPIRGFILHPLMITMAFYLIFVWLGGVIMPRGHWIFRNFSLFFY